MCQGQGDAHWCGSCCKVNGRCGLHPRQHLIKATSLYTSIFADVVPSSMGGHRPAFLEWDKYRNIAMMKPVVFRSRYHPITSTNMFTQTDTIANVYAKLSFVESAVFSFSDLAPIQTTVCLSSGLVAVIKCNSTSFAVKLLCFAPVFDRQYNLYSKVSLVGTDIMCGSIPLSTKTPTDKWYTASLKMIDSVTGAIPQSALCVAHFWLDDGLGNSRSHSL